MSNRRFPWAFYRDLNTVARLQGWKDSKPVQTTKKQWAIGHLAPSGERVHGVGFSSAVALRAYVAGMAVMAHRVRAAEREAEKAIEERHEAISESLDSYSTEQLLAHLREHHCDNVEMITEALWEFVEPTTKQLIERVKDSTLDVGDVFPGAVSEAELKVGNADALISEVAHLVYAKTDGERDYALQRLRHELQAQNIYHSALI